MATRTKSMQVEHMTGKNGFAIASYYVLAEMSKPKAKVRKELYFSFQSAKEKPVWEQDDSAIQYDLQLHKYQFWTFYKACGIALHGLVPPAYGRAIHHRDRACATPPRSVHFMWASLKCEEEPRTDLRLLKGCLHIFSAKRQFSYDQTPPTPP